MHRLGFVALSLVATGCTFDVAGIDLDAAFDNVPDALRSVDSAPDPTIDAAGEPDLAAPIDAAGPDVATPLDLSRPPPMVRLAIDARGPNVGAALAQPFLTDVNGSTQAHYRFDEMGDGPAMDHGGRAIHLAPAGGPFGGRRGVFTQIPQAAGMGLRRVATEFVGSGFVAAGAEAMDVGAQDFTIEAWFKLPPGYAPRSMNGCDPIAAKGAAAGYSLCALAGGRLRLTVAYPGGAKQVTTMEGFADGAWHLGAFVFGVAGANRAAVHVDGRAVTLDGRDLATDGKSLANGEPFRIGGDNDKQAFRGSLAELVFHANRIVQPGEHAASYRAFGLPVSPAGAAADVAYARDGTLCTVVAESVGEGDQVACYAGGAGAQVALARNALADAAGNSERLGLALGPARTNYTGHSEALETWRTVNKAIIAADAAASPRGDRTAESITLPLSSYAFNPVAALPAAGTVTYSIWLRGRSNDDRVFFFVSDANAAETQHCLVRLTTGWRRHRCTRVFQMNRPGGVRIGLDAVGQQGDPMPPLPTVSFDAWGAQVEVGREASSYGPNATAQPVAFGPVLMTIKNTPQRYLDGASGRVVFQFAPTDGAGDAPAAGSHFLDSSPAAQDRHYVRLEGNGDLVAEVLDTMGAGALDSRMTIKAPDWSAARTIALSWSSGPTLPGGNDAHTQVSFDGATTPGRSLAGFTAAAPVTLWLLSDQSGKNQPAGTLPVLTLFDAP